MKATAEKHTEVHMQFMYGEKLKHLVFTGEKVKNRDDQQILRVHTHHTLSMHLTMALSPNCGGKHLVKEMP